MKLRDLVNAHLSVNVRFPRPPNVRRLFLSGVVIGLATGAVVTSFVTKQWRRRSESKTESPYTYASEPEATVSPYVDGPPHSTPRPPDMPNAA